MKTPVIALTGPMCAGKNFVASILEQRYGCVSIDADVVCHTVLTTLQPQIIRRFANYAAENSVTLEKSDGTLDRRALGELLFARPELLVIHESMVHPEIDKHLTAFIAEHQNSPVLLNATVLYKTPSLSHCSALIYVDAPMIIRFFRALRRDKMHPRQILKRFYVQKDLFTQYSSIFSDIYRVKNCGIRSILEHQLQNVMKNLLY